MAFKKRQKQIPKGIHAYIATPAYDGRVLSEYATSLAETCQIATLAGIKVTATIMRNGAFIDIARNTLVRLFLETDCTHLFFIDADLKWEARAVIGLLTAGLPICAGAYPKRQDPEEYPVRPKPTPEGNFWVENGWVMCDRVATGFLCIERKVIEEMVKDAPIIRSPREPDTAQLFYTYRGEDGMFVGEDFAFCIDYEKKYGKPIPVWPDFDFTHGGDWSGNWHHFLNRYVEEEEKKRAAG